MKPLLRIILLSVILSAFGGVSLPVAHAGKWLDFICNRDWTPRPVALDGVWKTTAEQADRKISGPYGWAWKRDTHGSFEGSTLGKSRLGLLMNEPENPVLRVLKASGARFTRGKIQVSVAAVMQELIREIDRAVEIGLLRPEDAIYPGGIFRGPQGDFQFIRWGHPIPAGYVFQARIHLQTLFMESLASNVFPMGGADQSADLDFFRVGTVMEHDLFHVIGMTNDLRYMAAIAQTAKKLLPLVREQSDRVTNPHSGLQARLVWAYESLEVISQTQAKQARQVVTDFLEPGGFENQSYAKISEKISRLNDRELEQLRKKLPAQLSHLIQRIGGSNIDPIVRLGAHHELFQQNLYAPGMWLTQSLISLERTGWLRREGVYLKETLAKAVGWVVMLSEFDAGWWVLALVSDGAERDRMVELLGKYGRFSGLGWETFIKE
jgi:hypothetical protein